MRLFRSPRPLGAALALAFVSCNPGDGVAPRPSLQADLLVATALPAVRISEIHYDNTGTDVGEAIEISGPAGSDLTGWSVVLYNGSGGAPYSTTNLTGSIPTTCDPRGVVVINYPLNGIQNGSPDGVALVTAGGAVVEFLSYEGAFAAVGGPAGGMTSTDIGASETGSEPLGLSLQRNGAGGWNGPVARTFGACNDDDEPPPPPPPPPLPETRFAELHYDNEGTDIAEAIEIEGPAGADLNGWRVVLYNGSGGAVYDTRALAGTIVARCGGRGVVAATYPSNGIQNGSPDGLALVDAAGAVVEFLSYEGTFRAADGPAAGLTSTDIGVAEASSTALGRSLQRLGTGSWQAAAQATFGACNEGDSGLPPPPVLTLTFTGRTASDPALPVGFQDQLFATLVDATRTVVPTTLTWTSDRPDVAGVDQDGVVTALGPGTAIVRVTAAEGTTATFSLPTRIAVASTTAQYANNTEFGGPRDGDASDDFIVQRAQYTASYNHTRGTPNWVSYELEATHFGGEDRCDCFTFDPELPAAFTHYTTADYTGAGAFHGYGIDRGHLARSFDRTSGSLDNATTFYFTNIVPQAADLNQGPWAALETFLGDLARFEDREVYIVAGVAGSKGTVKDEGQITIPASTWKVALILPRDSGLASVHSYADVEVVAVIMPNDPGVRNVDWATYRATVNAVEALSGYDLLTLLPDDIEATLESGMHTVQALIDGLVADGKLKGGVATSLTAKLRAAAQQLEGGKVSAGVSQLGSFLNELDALVRAGRLAAAEAEPLRAAAGEVMASAVGGP
jgi:DNA/RNA endonuclease G (NUC1)